MERAHELGGQVVPRSAERVGEPHYQARVAVHNHLKEVGVVVRANSAHGAGGHLHLDQLRALEQHHDKHLLVELIHVGQGTGSPTYEASRRGAPTRARPTRHPKSSGVGFAL